jgi:molecular chaperone GrpE
MAVAAARFAARASLRGVSGAGVSMARSSTTSRAPRVVGQASRSRAAAGAGSVATNWLPQRRWLSAAEEGAPGAGEGATESEAPAAEAGAEAAGAEAAAAEGADPAEDPRDKEIAMLREQLQEAQDKLLLSMAERENIRKIAKEDVARAVKFGVKDFAKEVLLAVDNIEFALVATDKAVGLKRHGCETVYTDAEVDEAFGDNKLARDLYEGIRLTEFELIKSMGKHHIKRFSPLGEKFDPNTMNALLRMPSDDYLSGEVAVVMKSGYMHHARTLRAADVGVVQ